MADTPIDFASLLCSRLCHDLMGPVGAITNGIELLADEDDPDARARCMDLLAEGARTSIDKLKFFRLAFGAAGGSGAGHDAREVKAAVEGLIRGNGRIVLGWLVDRPTIARDATRILLNLVLIAADALIRGGRLDIDIEGDEIVVRAEGARLVLDPDVRATLAGEIDAEKVGARTAGAWLARSLTIAGGGRIQIADEIPGILLLGAALPA